MSMSRLAIFAFGTLEGYWFYRSGLLMPDAISKQMKFESFIVLKLFLAAVGSSMVAQSIWTLFNPSAFDKTRKYSVTSPGYARAVIGCGILGVGMAMAGSGPTLLPGQLVSLATGYYTVLGAFLGGLAYALIEPRCFSTNLACRPSDVAIDAKLHLKYATLAAPFGLALVAGALTLEQLFPHSQDAVGAVVHAANLAGPLPAWLFNPIVAGTVVGLNQIPLRAIAGVGQGGSTSVMTLLSAATGLSARLGFDGTLHRSAQVIYVWGGTTVGALAAAYTSPLGVSHLYAGVTKSALLAVAGGALMIFGGRVANGCTCGHGISGVSELSLASMAAAAAIFGGGIAYAMGLALN